MSAMGWIYPFKDSIVGIDVNVYVIQVGDLPAEAHITMVLSRQYTDMEFDVSAVSKEAKSETIRILRGETNGYWVAPIGGNEVFVEDNEGILRDIIESIEP